MNMYKDKSPYYAVVVPINRNGQVLIGLRSLDGLYTIPGGGANAGEQPEDCAVREAWEEAQLLISKDRLEPLDVVTAPNGIPVFTYLFRCNQNQTSTASDPDREVPEWVWYDQDDLPKGLTRKNNQNRLDTINQAYLKFYGLRKSLVNENELDEVLSKGKAYPVGTERIWNGVKHRKTTDGKWTRIEDKKPAHTQDADENDVVSLVASILSKMGLSKEQMASIMTILEKYKGKVARPKAKPKGTRKTRSDKGSKKGSTGRTTGGGGNPISELKKALAALGLSAKDLEAIDHIIDGPSEAEDQEAKAQATRDKMKEFYRKKAEQEAKDLAEWEAKQKESGGGKDEAETEPEAPAEPELKEKDEDSQKGFAGFLGGYEAYEEAQEEAKIENAEKAEEETKKAVDTATDNPRKKAEAAQKAEFADQSAYYNAVDHKVGNLGEDLLGSARHKRGLYNESLAKMEAEGNAAEIITRKELIKNAPLDLPEITESNMYDVYGAKLLLSWIIPGPKKKYRHEEDNVSARKGYYNGYFAVKKILEDSLNQSEDLDRVLSLDNSTALPREEGADILALSVMGRIKNLVKENRVEYQSLATAAYRSNFTNHEEAKARRLEIYHENQVLVKLYNSSRVNASYMATPSKYQNGTWVDLPERRVYPKGSIAEKMHEFDNLTEEFDADGKLEVMDKLVHRNHSLAKATGTSEKKAKRVTLDAFYLNKNPKRKGGPAIPDSQKGQEDVLRKKVGLRAVNYGNSMTKPEEREHHLKKSAEAFTDITDILGLPAGMGSFNGRLGLAIGARGKGTALAHYEPSTKIINLTRENGVGSLAHEWGHFFDNIVADLTPTSEYKKRKFMSEVQFGESKRLTHADHSDNQAHIKAEAAVLAGKTDEATQILNDIKFPDPDYFIEDVRRTHNHNASIADKPPVHQAFTDLMTSKPMRQLKKNVEAWGKAKGMRGTELHKYWSSDIELFARSFEAHVALKLNDKGRENTYLTKKSYGDSDHEMESVYPSESMQRELAPLFDKIFSEFKNSDMLQKALVMLDAQASLLEKLQKSEVSMGHLTDGGDIETADFAEDNNHADQDLLERIRSAMQSYEYGDVPQTFDLVKGTLSLAAVDEGLYSGFFTSKADGMEDTAQVRIEKQTLPTLVQLITAKDWNYTPKQMSENEIVEYDAKESLLDKIAGMSYPEDDVCCEAENTLTQKIALVTLLNKLLSV